MAICAMSAAAESGRIVTVLLNMRTGHNRSFSYGFVPIAVRQASDGLPSTDGRPDTRSGDRPLIGRDQDSTEVPLETLQA